MNLGITLAVLSAVCTTIAYLDYNQAIINGQTKPNGATWAIWSSISLISTFSYFAASGDFWKTILPFTNIILCSGTFILSLVRGSFSKLDPADWIALATGIIASIVWKMTNPACGNLVVQVAIIIGFWPTWRGVWRNPHCEKSRPWWTWTIAYGVAGTVVILRWRHQWVDLLYPWLSVFLHASVPIVGRVSGKRQNI
jgi:hypothetical protein